MKIGLNAMFVITMATRVYYVISSLALISGKLSSWSQVIGTGMLLVPLVIPVADKILVRKYWDIITERKVYQFTIDESEGSTVERMENGVKEREKAVEVCEVGIKEEIGVKVMVWAGPGRSGLVGSPAGLGWVLSKFRRGPK
jgi:hypothetical protein